MRLFDLLYAATVEKDPDATWAIIDLFEPLLDAKSYSRYTKIQNEDLKSEMRLILYKRIQNFDIYRE